MTLPRTLLAVACLSLAMPAAAANSAYDLLIFACDRQACTMLVEQKLSSGLANIAEYNRSGLKLMIEALARRTNEEDTRVSLDVRPAVDGAPRAVATSAAQRLETLVVTLKQETFSPLTTFVSGGTTYQVWARLAAVR